MRDGPIYEGRDLACIRGERLVFAGLEFALAPGDALLVTGPNGSGKSSLLRLLAGLLPAAAGEVRWKGTPTRTDPEAFAAEFHYVGHLDAVKPSLTVQRNLAFWAGLRGGDAGAVDAGLDAVGLAHLADLPARFLSAGQKRRLGLARLFATPAPLWLLDEPTIALDRASVAAVETALDRHRAAGGIAVVSTNADMRIDRPIGLDLRTFVPEAHAGPPDDRP